MQNKNEIDVKENIKKRVYQEIEEIENKLNNQESVLDKIMNKIGL